MADASSAVAAPLHAGLPNEIAIWEILVCLPPKSLLRCHAVCRDWRGATSTREFLLAHHGRQPCLPLLYNYDYDTSYIDIVPIDHRAGVAAEDQLQSVARLGDTCFGLEASCDGLLVFYDRDRFGRFSICNPATHHGSNQIMVFDTTAESFRQMHSPAHGGASQLCEMDGMFVMSRLNYSATDIDIWVLQDYEREVWAFKCRVRLPIEEIRVQFQKFDHNWEFMIASSDDDMLILLQFGHRLLQINIDGKLVASFYREGLGLTTLQLKQTLVLHTFFPTLEGYVLNDFPFM
ncbi:unnamed protein product [Alopecurus aequalis]